MQGRAFSLTTRARTMKPSPPVVRLPFASFLASMIKEVGEFGAPSARRPGPNATHRSATVDAYTWKGQLQEVKSLAPIFTRIS